MSQCNALDNQGKKCRASKNLERYQYSGDNETYGAFNEPWPAWVLVLLCPKHRDDKFIAAVKARQAEPRS